MPRDRHKQNDTNMPFISGLGDPISGLTSVITAGIVVGTPLGGPVWDQEPFLQVTVGGTLLVNVLSATMSHGLDIVVATATVELTENPGGIPYNSEVQITCGAGVNNAMRFRGLFKKTVANMWPHTWSMVCRGMLSRADEFQQAKGAALPGFVTSILNQRLPIVGMTMADLVGTNPATDGNYVLAVLNQVPDLVVSPDNIHDTGHIFTEAFKDLTWQPYVTALAQCQKLDEVSLGMRLFESLGGVISRQAVFGYPTAQGDTQFTEGVDVLTGIGERSVEQLANAVYVEGATIGAFPGLIMAYVTGSNGLQGDAASSPHIVQVSSQLIDSNDFALAVGEWKLGEVNRETVDVTLTTFRDDVIAPGRTVAVFIPHAAVTEPVWVQHVDIEVRSDPILFQQTIRGIGGGLPPAPDTSDGTTPDVGGSGLGGYPPPDWRY